MVSILNVRSDVIFLQDPKVKDGMWAAPESVQLVKRKPPPEDLESLDWQIQLALRFGGDTELRMLPGGDRRLGRAPTGLGLPLAWLREWRESGFAELAIAWDEGEMLDFQREEGDYIGGQALPGWYERRITQRRARLVGAADTRTVLDGFLGLATGTPQDIVAFAERYGPLLLCQAHGHPLAHCRSTNLATPYCFLTRPESLLYWVFYSLHARAIVRLASALRGSRVPNLERDWALLLGIDANELAARQAALEADEIAWDKWGFLSQEVQRWLEWGNVKPWFGWTEGASPSLDEVGDGLFGAIAKHLVHAVIGVERELCYECQTPYTPTRKPRADQRNFCPKCRQKGAPNKWAQRDHKARERSRGSVRVGPSRPPKRE